MGRIWILDYFVSYSLRIRWNCGFYCKAGFYSVALLCFTCARFTIFELHILMLKIPQPTHWVDTLLVQNFEIEINNVLCLKPSSLVSNFCYLSSTWWFQLNYGMFLEWNTTKNLSSIWQLQNQKRVPQVKRFQWTKMY